MLLLVLLISARSTQGEEAMEPMDMGDCSSAVATIVRGAEGRPHTFVEVWFEESDDRQCWSATEMAGGGGGVFDVLPGTGLRTVLRLLGRRVYRAPRRQGAACTPRKACAPSRPR